MAAFADEIITDAQALQMRPAHMPPQPDFAAERLLLGRGLGAVCGVDEVGRGSLAGPVLAAAVILDAENLPQGLRDSKQLSAGARARLAADILARARAVAYASLPAEFIDAGNIRSAALTAMRMAMDGLATAPDYALIDGRDIPPNLSCPAAALIKGDSRSLSIAAASILAKIMRDSMMALAGCFHPAYGFGSHVGYGTAQHKTALAQEGALPGLHRFSFAPLKALRPRQGA